MVWGWTSHPYPPGDRSIVVKVSGFDGLLDISKSKSWKPSGRRWDDWKEMPVRRKVVDFRGCLGRGRSTQKRKTSAKVKLDPSFFIQNLSERITNKSFETTWWKQKPTRTYGSTFGMEPYKHDAYFFHPKFAAWLRLPDFYFLESQWSFWKVSPRHLAIFSKLVAMILGRVKLIQLTYWKCILTN